ncbi:hypothetical protein O185_11210 [Photorhabdus temperata J3]|uniref:Amidohydrolase n=2 Tax=Photorhabdus temperata TaxID=574560 RepID=U7R0P3_PHOTE|nr:hypothetical protein O185_11210 [Photorhabdus temperata J3]
MTGTQLNIRFDKACSNYIPNRTMERVMYQYIQAFGIPEYTDEERQFAEKIHQTLTKDDLRNAKLNAARTAGEEGKRWCERQGEKVLTDEVLPYIESQELMYGSTDVGDVSWVTPTAQCFSPCFAFGTPLHTWQLVAQGRSSIAHKGMCLAGKIMAATALKLLIDPALLTEVQSEFRHQRNEYPYQCPIPPDIKPSPLK